MLVLRSTLLPLACFVLSEVALSQLGPLDVTFGDNGIFVSTMVGSPLCTAMALQPDGKIIMAGKMQQGQSTDGVLVRLTVSGTLDATFSQDGMIQCGGNGQLDQIEDVVIRPDGSILLIGWRGSPYSDRALMCFQSNGSIDSTFGAAGVVPLTTATSSLPVMALRPNGRLLLASDNTAGVLLQQLLPDGAVDTAFGAAGQVQLPREQSMGAKKTLALAPDGRVFVPVMDYVNSDYVTKMYSVLENGTLDSSYADAGCAIVNWNSNANVERLWSIALDAAGRIVLGGTVYNGNVHYSLVARLTASGALDTTFATSGFALNQPGLPAQNVAGALCVLADGSIMQTDTDREIGMLYSQTVVLKFDGTGTLDPTFGVGGILWVPNPVGIGLSPFDMHQQPDGKVLIGGNVQSLSNGFYCTRLENNVITGLPADQAEDAAVAPMVLVPNPAHDHARLIFSLREKCNVSMALYDLTGRLLSQPIDLGNLQPGEHSTAVDIPPVPPGVYAVELRAGAQRSSTKLVIE